MEEGQEEEHTELEDHPIEYGRKEYLEMIKTWKLGRTHTNKKVASRIRIKLRNPN